MGERFTPPAPNSPLGQLRQLNDRVYLDVLRFNEEVIGLPVPSTPQVLSGPRLDFGVGHMREELEEFEASSREGNVEEAADALIDLIYVAMGRLIEMGVAPYPVFKEVHRANMEKRQGEVAKRPDSLGHDAVKPEGWRGPDHSWLLRFNAEDRELAEMRQRRQVDVATLRVLSPVFLEVTRLRAKKTEDYNSGDHGFKGPQLSDYFPFGHQSYVQMLHVKYLRIRSLLASGKTPNFEGLRDSLKDLLNYTTFYVEAIDRGELDPAGSDEEDAA